MGLRMTELQGEWWINEDGTAIFADGDVGDANHETVIVLHCARQVLGIFEDSEHEHLLAARQLLLPMVEADGVDIHAAREEMFQLGNSLREAGEISLEQDNDFFAYLQELSEVDGDVFDCVFDINKDTRLYGVQGLQWIRVRGNNVEMWELTRLTLKQAADGLWDAYGEQVEEAYFNFEVRKDGKFYRQVPWIAIAEESVRWVKREAKEMPGVG